MQIVFSTPFTGKTPYSDTNGQEWYIYRFNIWKYFTLENLKNQIDKDFLWWLQFKQTDEDNPITKKIRLELEKSNIKYVMTFDGPIMKEDRAIWHNDDLIKRSVRSLKALQRYINDEWVCEVNLDSDDMVSKDFVKSLKARESKDRKAFYMKDGYMLNIEERLAEWNNPFSMAIYGIVYPKDIFLNAKKHFEYQNGFDSHEQIPDKFDAELLPKGMFCCVNHRVNISTVWNHQFRGKEILNNEEKSKILNKFL